MINEDDVVNLFDFKTNEGVGRRLTTLLLISNLCEINEVYVEITTNIVEALYIN